MKILGSWLLLVLWVLVLQNLAFANEKPNRALMGISMGAFGALHFGLKHPEKFRVIGGLGGPVEMKGLVSSISKTMSSYTKWHSLYFEMNELFNMVHDLNISFGNLLYEGGDDPLYPEVGGTAPCRYKCRGSHALVPVLIKGWNLPHILAIDANDNKKFDVGEPLAHHMFEPFLNADSSGWREEGELFEDVGLDGIPNTDDYGEANNKWDYDPDIDTLFKHDPYTFLKDLPEGDLAQLHFYLDAGRQDEFEFDKQNDTFAELLASRDASFQYASYPPFLGRHAYFRYVGDHVGLPNPFVVKRRLTNAVSFVSTKLPGGKYGSSIWDWMYPSTLKMVSMESRALARVMPFGLYLPGGYSWEKNRDYPVIYFLIGYGDKIKGFINKFTKAILDFMVYSRQLKKSIIVLLDGRSESIIRGRRSHFYVNQKHPDGDQWEDFFLELIDHIDDNYRTQPAKRWY